MNRTRKHIPVCLIAVFAGLAASAIADTQIEAVDYENSQTRGWLVNGQDMLFPGEGNPGQAGGVPLLDFWGITARNDTPGSALVGDISRHGGPLRVEIDINILTLNNFFDEPMNPAWFPLTIEFVDYRDSGPVSVYYTGTGLAPTGTWGTFSFTIPDPTQAALPAGWGGTGDEDPVTYEPRLPAGVTYASVLANVDEARITTMRPGYFYSSNWWEARVDNIGVFIAGGATCDSIDFNNDGLFPDTADIDDFLSVFSGGTCSNDPNCGDVDFNNDSLFPDTADIDAFLTVFSGGQCG